MSTRVLIIVVGIAALIIAGIAVASETIWKTVEPVATEHTGNLNVAATTNLIGSSEPDPTFGGLLISKERSVNTDTTPPTDPLFPYAGRWSLTSLIEPFRKFGGVNTFSIGFRGNTAVFGGDRKKLFSYDGNEMKDLSPLIQGDTDEEKSNKFPRVEHIAAAPKYWIIDVYGSNYHKVYTYYGTTLGRIPWPELQRSTAIESSAWTGKELLLGDLGGRVFSYNGTVLTELHGDDGDAFTGGAVVASNGKEHLVFLPGTPHHLYRIVEGKLIEIPDPDFSGLSGNPPLIETLGWNGKYWLAGGGKLWKYEGGAWTVLSDTLPKLDASILALAWSGTYWVISGTERTWVYDGSSLTNITADLSGMGVNRWASAMGFGDAYGLIAGGSGSNGGVVRIERKRSVNTVNSNESFSCYSPAALKSVPVLDKLLTKAGYRNRSFVDLCISTNRNPQQRFYTLETVPKATQPNTNSTADCVGCFTIHAFALPTGKEIGTPGSTNPFIREAETCGFGGIETTPYQEQLMLNCSLPPPDHDHRYYNRYNLLGNGSFVEPIFSEQCSIWRSDLTESVLDGQVEKTLAFPSQEAHGRCGNADRTPLQKDWLAYDQGGLRFNYPPTWYLGWDDSDGKRTFTIHPRNLGGGEGGGPWNPLVLELLPPTTQDEAFAVVQQRIQQNKDAESKVVKKVVNGQPAVVYTPGPGLCGGSDEVYLIGANHALHYNAYCGDWQNVDQTFRVE